MGTVRARLRAARCIQGLRGNALYALEVLEDTQTPEIATRYAHRARSA